MAKKNPRIVQRRGENRAAVIAVKKGADVRDYRLAQRLREVEATMPGMVSIGDCQMGPYHVREVLPYFGVIATNAGIKWARTK